ncbi:hypothetical protein [Bacillus pseudomycoides]|uniref:hypothetical protein n=1 Tax=Bacillus pseudomycoides TaxID=64104 RepID=UPI000BFE61E0|nr:hypothetical protein [Bacillus pseudomycoides]MBD5798184.1 hypothetical protein [Bacillus pseudomycoides]PHG24656.1 hypothetical protein COI47_07650 [Bacillus pseudomycoides]
MDKKVTIPKLVAEELSQKLERYGKEGAAYMMLEMCDSSNDATYEWLSTKGNVVKLASAIEFGYEIQEDKLLKRYQWSKSTAETSKDNEDVDTSWHIGHYVGIEDALDILGITIKGINDQNSTK